MRARLRSIVALLLVAFSAQATWANDCFDDKRLMNLQHNTMPGLRGALVYVWSPRMVYSVDSLQVAARAAAANGLAFVALHDLRIPQQELTDAAGSSLFSLSERSMALCAPALLTREALRHFPTSFVITASGIHQHPIVGAMPEGAWLSSIKQRLEQP